MNEFTEYEVFSTKSETIVKTAMQSMSLEQKRTDAGAGAEVKEGGDAGKAERGENGERADLVIEERDVVVSEYEDAVETEGAVGNGREDRLGEDAGMLSPMRSLFGRLVKNMTSSVDAESVVGEEGKGERQSEGEDSSEDVEGEEGEAEDRSGDVEDGGEDEDGDEDGDEDETEDSSMDSEDDESGDGDEGSGTKDEDDETTDEVEEEEDESTTKEPVQEVKVTKPISVKRKLPQARSQTANKRKRAANQEETNTQRTSKRTKTVEKAEPTAIIKPPPKAPQTKESLQKTKGRNDRATTQAQKLPDSEDDVLETRYTPLKVHSSRLDEAGNTELLVQWAGYPSEKDWTWEPRDRLQQDAKSFVERYERERKAPVKKKKGKASTGMVKAQGEVETYEVKEILKKKTIKGSVYYLVRWKGWEAKKWDTWEEEGKLIADIPGMVKDWEDRYGGEGKGAETGVGKASKKNKGRPRKGV
ncbi:hypothetical protein ACMFMG_011342 [Clarireedia jacksonii]